MSKSAVAVVIVNYNTREHLLACLTTIRMEAPREVVVVDNASRDGSAALVRAEFPEVVLQPNTTNYGYGAAANQGIRACHAETVLLLNSDTLLRPGAIAALGNYVDRHPRFAVVGPRLLSADGTRQPSCFPFLTPLNVLVLNTILSRFVAVLPGLREHFDPAWPHDKACRVPWVKGAAIAIRREAFEAVGGFDEAYFMYAEELDLCYRLRAIGWETHFAPVTSVTHVEGASTNQVRPEMLSRLFASIRRFYMRHYPPVYLPRLRWAVTAIMWQRILKDTIRLHRARDPALRNHLADDLLLWRRIRDEEGCRSTLTS
jgi:N-acetylglucosaminyl-diphospho-decaprenol L-rhamnosyltransferase